MRMKVCRVEAVDEERLVGVFAPLDGSPNLETTLNVMEGKENGIYVVPRVGTEAVLLVEEQRAFLVRVREYDKVLIVSEAGTRLLFEDDHVVLETPAGIQAKLEGDNIEVTGLSRFLMNAQKVQCGPEPRGGVITDLTLPACLFSGAPMRNFSSKNVEAG